MSSTSVLLIVGTKPKTNFFFSGGHTRIRAATGIHSFIHTDMNEVYGQNACAYTQTQTQTHTHTHTHTQREGSLES
jgi:hypothetical protein